KTSLSSFKYLPSRECRYPYSGSASITFKDLFFISCFRSPSRQPLFPSRKSECKNRTFILLNQIFFQLFFDPLNHSYPTIFANCTASLSGCKSRLFILFCNTFFNLFLLFFLIAYVLNTNKTKIKFLFLKNLLVLVLETLKHK
ncbi:hypothetical protein SAMN05444380_105171, partial [Thermophagus xiamenensis]